MNGMTFVKEWWSGLSRREQKMLGFLAVIIVALVVWFGIYKPLIALRIASSERAIAAAHRLDKIENITSVTSEKNPGNIKLQMERAARAAELFPQYDESDSAYIRFKITQASSSAARSWLQALDREGVALSALTITREQDGLLNVSGAAELS